MWPGARVRRSRDAISAKPTWWLDRLQFFEIDITSVLQTQTEGGELEALERLALLEPGERGNSAIAWAVMRFLDGARHLSAFGDALWPADEEE
jgi:hypothetical protein